MGGKISNAIRQGLNAATEAKDILDAAWGALPPWMKTLRPGEQTSPYDKAVDLWNAWNERNNDRVDWSEWSGDFAKNLARNQVGDFVGGRVGRATRRANQQMPNFRDSVRRGFATGPAL